MPNARLEASDWAGKQPKYQKSVSVRNASTKSRTESNENHKWFISPVFARAHRQVMLLCSGNRGAGLGRKWAECCTARACGKGRFPNSGFTEYLFSW